MLAHVPLTQHLKSHLLWWKNSANRLKDRYLQLPKINVTITTERLWVSYGKTDFLGSLELRTETLAHKLFGNESCNFDSSAFSDNFEGKMCSDKERQHKRSTIHKTSRGNEVTKFMSPDLGTMADNNSKQQSIESSPYYGIKNVLADHLSREKVCPTERSLNKSMVQQIFQIWGTPLIDLFASWENRQTEIFCTWIPHPNALAGCSDNSLEEHVRICISPNLSDSKDIAIYEAVPLVHRNFTVTDSLPNKTTSNGQFVVSVQNENVSFQSRNIKSVSMVSFDRRFLNQQEHCSQLHGEDYASKLEKFNSWCGERQIDPYSANLNQIADFLAYLFHSGLQYRTIVGYRSMLSAVLPPVQNFPVGQHHNIVRIIKGVFYSRPPKVRILAGWNLELLLQALEKYLLSRRM